jgi:hypothetical protein
MKKKLLSLILASTIGTTLNAQSILNGDFENWTDYSVESPDNSGMFQFGTKETIDKTQGNFSVKLENQIKDSKVDVGVVIFGKADDGIKGGLPYNGAPDSLVGYAKYDIKNTDAAIVWVKVWAGGNSTGVDNMYFITGNSSNGFVRLAYKLNLGSGVVDSVAIGLTSGNFSASPVLGSWIIWDDIQFVGTNATQISNTDFENWTTNKLYENPNSWNTLNSDAYQSNEAIPVVKSNNSHNGNYALKSTANIKLYNSNYYDLGAVKNFNYNSVGEGFNFTNTIDTLVYWYKLNSSDSGSVTVNLRNGANYVGYAQLNFPPSVNWTEFKVPLSGLNPLKIEIQFSAAKSNLTGTQQSGSVLEIDDMTLMSDLTVGVKNIYNNTTFSVYPNPIQNEIFVSFDARISEETTLTIYSIEGKLLQTKSFTVNSGNNLVSMSTADLSSGMYQYVLSNEDSTLASGKLVK